MNALTVTVAFHLFSLEKASGMFSISEGQDGLLVKLLRHISEGNSKALTRLLSINVIKRNSIDLKRFV
jgi:hypothetical protein